MAQKLVDLIKNKLGDDEISEQEIEDRINIEDLKKIYDSIIDEYNSVENNNKMNDDDQRIRYLISIIKSLRRLTRAILANKMLLDHELYVVICNKLSDILVQWKNEQYLNQTKSEYFQNMVRLFYIFTCWRGGCEKETIEKIVLDEKFVKPIELCLSSINENNSLLLNDNMNNIRNFSNLIRNMESFCEYQSMDKSHLILLLNSIMNYIYINYDPNLLFFDLGYDKGINNKILDENQQEEKFCLLCQFESCLTIVSHNDIIIQSLISIICNMNLHKQVESDDSCGSASDLINEISGVLFEMIKDNEELLIMLKNHKTVKENLIGACFPIWAFNVPLVPSEKYSEENPDYF
ncbi:unnamed protein product [Rotaria sp. Silwood2]|nr:unnamed protein product [Rotaria sp. Silwood2]